MSAARLLFDAVKSPQNKIYKYISRIAARNLDAVKA